MADEQELQSTPENTEVNETPVKEGTSQHEYSDVEKQAMAQGWVPEDQWEGTGKWRSAEDFLDRGELFHKIDEQGRKLRATESVISELKSHLKKVRETEFKRALATLRAEKREALDAGDTSRVVEIDDQIADTKVEQQREMERFERAQAQPEAPNPQFVAWVNRNSWYQTDKAMKVYADTVGDELTQNGMRNPIEILQEVERRVKKEFAHKFQNPNRNKPGSVEGGGSKGSGKNDTFQLTPEETQVMNKFVRAGVMTKEEYIADIKAERARGA